MEPTRNNALVDLLDRIMVKGVILYADLIISVSGIPLIGVNLRAAIAGMKTMLDYGMMEAWDETIRKHIQKNDEEEASLSENEEIGELKEKTKNKIRKIHTMMKASSIQR